MNVIISCAGKPVMIDGVRNHFLSIRGEPLIQRTIRQLNGRGITPTVVALESRYVLPGSHYGRADSNPRFYGQGRFRSSQDFWSPTGRTVGLLGDVFYTNEAIQTILSDTSTQLMMYGRMTASPVTGCDHGEIWAMSFYPIDIPKIIEVSDGVIADIEAGNLTSGASHWELYARWTGRDVWDLVPDHFTVIDDCTEDFDYVSDYENWRLRCEHS